MKPMPPIALPTTTFASFGTQWIVGSAFTKKQAMDFGKLLDSAVGESLSVMLGNIPIDLPTSAQLLPTRPDAVEVGPVRIVGGVRPQNFDVGYRPDGVRIAFDSKTLNDDASVGKNWQNMINDLATEATTVHSRFPAAVVGFLVCIPVPCLIHNASRASAMIGTLTRLGGRVLVDEPAHRAEALSLVLWDPSTGEIDPTLPPADSPLRIERFHEDLYAAYHSRYQGLPPHAA
nr:hypothetical protein [Propionibacterium sp.]